MLNKFHNRIGGSSMEIRQIQSFIMITQEGSFSKAAEILGYSQSAITVQIRLLENELGFKLFDRVSKRISLTPQGRKFLECATQISMQVRRAEQLKENASELHNPLHIGTLTSLCFSKFPPILNYFRQNHPKVTMRITTASPKELIEMMDRNQLDLIYILDRSRSNSSWVKVMEIPEPIVFAASPDFHLAGRDEISLDELLKEPFFLTERNENYRRELDHFLEACGKSLTPFLEISSTEFIIQMVKENCGITYLPYFAVQKAIQDGSLITLNVPDIRIQMYRQIFYHKDKWKTLEMEEFIRLAKENG